MRAKNDVATRLGSIKRSRRFHFLAHQDLGDERRAEQYSWKCQSGNDLFLNYTAVPEPSSELLGLSGAYLFLTRRRRAVRISERILFARALHPPVILSAAKNP